MNIINSSIINYNGSDPSSFVILIASPDSIIAKNNEKKNTFR
jgi:hypothetical protein